MQKDNKDIKILINVAQRLLNSGFTQQANFINNYLDTVIHKRVTDQLNNYNFNISIPIKSDLGISNLRFVGRKLTVKGFFANFIKPNKYSERELQQYVEIFEYFEGIKRQLTTSNRMFDIDHKYNYPILLENSIQEMSLTISKKSIVLTNEQLDILREEINDKRSILR